MSTMPTPTNPLNELADIHLPSGVSWWPLAPGWWGVIVLLILSATALYLWLRHRQRNRYRHLALQELQQAYQHHQQQPSAALYLQRINQILRRTAMSAYGHQFNPALKGEDWLHWLDNHSKPTQDSFTEGSGRALLAGPYQKTPQIDAQALQQLCVDWIQHHHNRQPKNATSTPTPPEATHV